MIWFADNWPILAALGVLLAAGIGTQWLAWRNFAVLILVCALPGCSLLRNASAMRAHDANMAALVASVEAQRVCLECGETLQAVNEADPMMLHPCLFECLDAIRDAVNAAEGAAAAVEAVE
jgi:hypothetical protein